MTQTKKRIVSIVLAAVLVAAGLWYYRSVDIHTLSGSSDADYIRITVIRHASHTLDYEVEARYVRLDRGEEGYEDCLARLEALRFRRPPTNPLLLAFPFLENLNNGPKVIDVEGDYYYDLYIGLADEVDEVWDLYLSFSMDEWEMRNFVRNVSLPLHCSEPSETVMALAAQWWEEGEP